MTKKQILKELDGCEIHSIQFEDLVTVDNSIIIRCFDGKRINPTTAQTKELWQEAFEEEFGTRNVAALLKEEFGE